MRVSLSITASLVLTAVFSTPSAGQSLQQCVGPFRQCAIEVQAECSRDPSGRVRMRYWDHPGYTMRFERCVGGIFEASGRPNPYKTGVTSSGGLTVPYTELLYPPIRDRN
jgi:hypothetical protein